MGGLQGYTPKYPGDSFRRGPKKAVEVYVEKPGSAEKFRGWFRNKFEGGRRLPEISETSGSDPGYLSFVNENIESLIGGKELEGVEFSDRLYVYHLLVDGKLVSATELNSLPRFTRFAKGSDVLKDMKNLVEETKRDMIGKMLEDVEEREKDGNYLNYLEYSHKLKLDGKEIRYRIDSYLHLEFSKDGEIYRIRIPLHNFCDILDRCFGDRIRGEVEEDKGEERGVEEEGQGFEVNVKIKTKEGSETSETLYRFFLSRGEVRELTMGLGDRWEKKFTFDGWDNSGTAEKFSREERQVMDYVAENFWRFFTQSQLPGHVRSSLQTEGDRKVCRFLWNDRTRVALSVPEELWGSIVNSHEEVANYINGESPISDMPTSTPQPVPKGLFKIAKDSLFEGYKDKIDGVTRPESSMFESLYGGITQAIREHVFKVGGADYEEAAKKIAQLSDWFYQGSLKDTIKEVSGHIKKVDSYTALGKEQERAFLTAHTARSLVVWLGRKASKELAKDSYKKFEEGVLKEGVEKFARKIKKRKKSFKYKTYTAGKLDGKQLLKDLMKGHGIKIEGKGGKFVFYNVDEDGKPSLRPYSSVYIHPIESDNTEEKVKELFEKYYRAQVYSGVLGGYRKVEGRIPGIEKKKHPKLRRAAAAAGVGGGAAVPAGLVLGAIAALPFAIAGAAVYGWARKAYRRAKMRKNSQELRKTMLY